MTETQGGTGGDMHNFDNWDVPLTFNDGRLPNEVDFWNNEEPSWIHDDTSTGPSAQSASSPPEGPQPQASQQPQGSTIQPKKMPRSSTGGGASSSTHAAFRSGPVQHLKTKPNQRKMRIGLQLKTGWRGRNLPLWKCDSMLQKIMRIKNRELRSYDQAEISSFPPSRALTTTHKYGTNLIWKQYLRRLTFHAALSFNMLTEGQLWFPHDQWERLRMVEALPPYHYVHRICQMQRISSDGGLGNVDIGHWRYGRGWNSKQAQETGEQDWAVHHWEALDGSMGWIGGAGEKQQISHLDGLDLSNEI